MKKKSNLGHLLLVICIAVIGFGAFSSCTGEVKVSDGTEVSIDTLGVDTVSMDTVAAVESPKTMEEYMRAGHDGESALWLSILDANKNIKLNPSLHKFKGKKSASNTHPIIVDTNKSESVKGGTYVHKDDELVEAPTLEPNYQEEEALITYEESHPTTSDGITIASNYTSDGSGQDEPSTLSDIYRE